MAVFCKTRDCKKYSANCARSKCLSFKERKRRLVKDESSDSKNSNSEHQEMNLQKRGERHEPGQWKMFSSKKAWRWQNSWNFQVLKRIHIDFLTREFRVKTDGGEYTITIGTTPSCTCPFNLIPKNNTKQVCKHMLWIYFHEFGVDDSSHVLYQVALTKGELTKLFSGAQSASVNQYLFTTSF